MQSAWSRFFTQKVAERRASLLESLLARGTEHERVAGMINGLDEALDIAGRIDGILSGEVSVDS